MASIQCEKNAEIEVQLSLEEKASLDEIIKQAECSVESDQILKQSHEIVVDNECLDRAAAANLRITAVVGGLKNQTKGPLHVFKSHKYAGHIVKNFSDPLSSAGAFAMSAMSNKGVKAAVVYSGKNKSGVDCGWLLAFADTKATGRRIYAECGPKCNFNNINWDDIEKKLDRSGAIAKPSDKQTGTSLYATIVGSSGKSVVAAAFLG